jgi:hypothetical protein
VNFLVLLAEADHFDKWDATDEKERARFFRDYKAFADAVRRRGSIVVGDALHRPESARTVQAGEARAVTEGPFAETVEQLGGFYVIDVPDLETAVELAALLPRDYVVEVRPTLGIDV